jgi:hypothetical protein
MLRSGGIETVLLLAGHATIRETIGRVSRFPNFRLQLRKTLVATQKSVHTCGAAHRLAGAKIADL